MDQIGHFSGEISYFYFPLVSQWVQEILMVRMLTLSPENHGLGIYLTTKLTFGSSRKGK